MMPSLKNGDLMKSREQYNQELIDYLFDHFTERLSLLPSWQFRDQLKHLYVEILDASAPDLFPVIHINVYPNGKESAA